MDGGIKVEGVNGAAPLPQRAQKNIPQGNKKPMNAQQQKQNDGADGAPAEKKPRFNQNGPNQNQGGGNQNKNFGNQNRGFGNRNNNRNQQNQNRGNQNQNQGNSQNQNQQNQNKQNQQNQQKQQQDVKPVGDGNQGNQTAIKKDVGPGPQQQQPQQQQQAQQQQPQQQTQNQQRNQQQNQQNQNQQHQNQQNQNMNHNQNRNRGGGGGPMGNQGGPGGNQGGQNRDRSRGGRGGPGDGRGNQGNGPYNRSDEFFIGQRLRAIGGPTHELPPVEATEEPKFSGRNRLYVGNLTNDISENELREMFKPYGEIGEIFCNAEKNFTFLKLDYHINAQRAKRELDGTMRKGRQLRVRFAPNATILRIKNLTPFVSNELLYRSFEIFGPIERANVVVDDRGKSTGEGIVEFAKKSSANVCLRFCNDKCFFLTASLRPCVVEPFEINEDDDGLPDKSLNKKSPEFHHERGVGPRFAELGSFEHEYGTRWKQLHELFKTKQDALKRELKMEEEKLEAQMEYARYEHETELLRQELRKRESDNERKKMEWEMREKQAEEMRKRDEESMRRQQNEMQSRMLRQEEEMRRRQQENTLFMQAQQLNSLLDQQEGFGGNNNGGNNFDNFGRASNNSPFEFRDPISALLGNNGGGGNGNGNGNGPNNPQNKRHNWVHNSKGRNSNSTESAKSNPTLPFNIQQIEGLGANIDWNAVKG
ncbi:protein no-on-transient A-like isoform X4 [Bactrocera neohumeralis]|nr:protein no-on-transient A-like isoform X4 [Bactrocera neohumeralis]